MIMNKKALLFLILSVLFSSGTVFALSAKQGMKMPPTVVQFAQVQKVNWQDSIMAIGTLSAFDGTMLSPEVSGRVTQMYFQSGQYVEKNAPLVQIYPDITKAQLEKAKAQYQLSTLDYNRNAKLYKLGYVDKSTLDKYRAQMDSDKADIDMYNAQLNQLLIRAPFAGVIGVNRISVGDYIKPGDNIASLQSMDPIRVDFSIPDVYLSQIKVGDKVIITSRAFNGSYAGEIFALDASVDTSTRNIQARAKVPNPNHTLIPGSFIEVNVRENNAQNVLLIPQTAIIYGTEGDYIYKMTDHKATKVMITIGKKIGNNQIIVEKGLTEGDIIIIAGQTKLYDGAPVMTPDEFKQMAAKMMADKQDKRD